MHHAWKAVSGPGRARHHNYKGVLHACEVAGGRLQVHDESVLAVQQQVAAYAAEQP